MNKPINLEQLQALDAIDRLGSFAGAAKELHKATSAISYSIQQLEQQFGIQIFDRSGHKARLTAAGRLLLTEGRKLLADSQRLSQKLSNQLNEQSEILRIAYDQSLDSNRLSLLVARFQQEQPHTSLYLQDHTLGGCWDALIHQRVDLALGVSGLMPDKLTYHIETMGELSFQFCVGCHHPLANSPNTLSPTQISAYTTIHLMDSARRLPEQNYDPQTTSHHIYTSRIENKIQLISLGVGIGFLPSTLAAAAEQQGLLIRKTVQYHRPSVILSAACLKHQRQQAGIQWWLKASKQLLG